MKKKVQLKDSVSISLLYLNEFVGKDTIDRKTSLEYNKILNKYLDNITISNIKSFETRIYTLKKDEEQEYYVLKKGINLNYEWENFVENVDQELFNVSSNEELLSLLGIIEKEKGKERKRRGIFYFE